MATTDFFFVGLLDSTGVNNAVIVALSKSDLEEVTEPYELPFATLPLNSEIVIWNSNPAEPNNPYSYSCVFSFNDDQNRLCLHRIDFLDYANRDRFFDDRQTYHRTDMSLPTITSG